MGESVHDHSGSGSGGWDAARIALARKFDRLASDLSGALNLEVRAPAARETRMDSSDLAEVDRELANEPVNPLKHWRWE